MRKKCDGNENEIEGGSSQCDAFPSPIAMRHECQIQNGESAENRGPWRHAKKSKAGANGDKFCDERQEIADSEIDHREPAPERPKSEKNQFGRSEEHTSELQSHSDLVCRLLLEKKKK